MANWVNVENNEVVGQYDELPHNWKNISGLNLANGDLPFLKSIGWYYVTKQHESYDESTHYISGYNYEIRENDVLETVVLTEKEPEVVEEFSLLKSRFIEQLRKERNILLINSDWTQLTDVNCKLDEFTKVKWMNYRQNLRDIVQVYLEDETTDINQVNWPAF